MSFFEDAIKKSSYSALFTDLDINKELLDLIRDELRVTKVEKHGADEFCDTLYKPDIQKIKEINPRLIPKVITLTKSGKNPIGQVIDGTLITSDMVSKELSAKKIDNFGVACHNGSFIAVDYRPGLENFYDGLSAHFIREVNDFRKELGLNVQDRIVLSWYFEFDRFFSLPKNLDWVPNVIFGRVFRNRRDFIMEEVLATEFFPSVNLDYFLYKYEDFNYRWHEDGGIRIMKL